MLTFAIAVSILISERLLSNYLFPNRFLIESSSEKILIREKISSLGYQMFQDLLVSACFIFVVSAYKVSEEILVMISSFIAAGMILRGFYLYRNRRQLIIDPKKKVLITTQGYINFYGSTAIEFLETFRNRPDGDIRVYAINLIITDGVRSNLLNVDLKEEAKKIFKVIHEVVKIDTIHTIERGLLGNVTKKVDFI